jgi:hypothetical protein
MFVATLQSLIPEYEGNRKVERWHATADASDSGPATIMPRFLRQVDPDGVEIDAFGGSNPSSFAVIDGTQVTIYLPGTTTATSYQIKLSTKFG